MSRRHPLIFGVAVFIATLLLLSAAVISRADPGSARAAATVVHPPAGPAATGNRLAQVTVRAVPATTNLAVTGAAQEDTCSACHLGGENKNPISSPLRWMIFGVMGIVFAFGIVRSATVWRTRAPWQPFTARAAQWVDSRYAVSAPLTAALSKPVPSYAQRWFYCLGGVTAFLFLTQAVTGTMLAFYYKPTPEAARASIEFIQNEVRFGAGVRFIHQMAANGMIVLCIAHMLRVFIMGAYKPPRELTWVTGVVLLLVTLGFGFTGYLLPWDQRAFWATTVGSEIGGSIPVIGGIALLILRVGWDVGSLTLTRFYAAHMILLPAVTIGMMVGHFLMIRRLGVARPL